MLQPALEPAQVLDVGQFDFAFAQCKGVVDDVVVLVVDVVVLVGGGQCPVGQALFVVEDQLQRLHMEVEHLLDGHHAGVPRTL